MAVAALKHYVAVLTTATSSTLVTVPALRALVIGKLLIASTGTANVSVALGASGQYVVPPIALSSGSVYTETSLVAVTTELVIITVNSISGGTVTFHVFGEEVDN